MRSCSCQNPNPQKVLPRYRNFYANVDYASFLALLQYEIERVKEIMYISNARLDLFSRAFCINVNSLRHHGRGWNPDPTPKHVFVGCGFHAAP